MDPSVEELEGQRPEDRKDENPRQLDSAYLLYGLPGAPSAASGKALDTGEDTGL